MAAPDPELITDPITTEIRDEIRTSTRGIPYHDKSGTASNRNILKAREEEVKVWKAQRDGHPQ